MVLIVPWKHCFFTCCDTRTIFQNNTAADQKRGWGETSHNPPYLSTALPTTQPSSTGCHSLHDYNVWLPWPWLFHTLHWPWSAAARACVHRTAGGHADPHIQLLLHLVIHCCDLPTVVLHTSNCERVLLSSTYQPLCTHIYLWKTVLLYVRVSIHLFFF